MKLTTRRVPKLFDRALREQGMAGLEAVFAHIHEAGLDELVDRMSDQLPCGGASEQREQRHRAVCVSRAAA